MSDFDRSGLPKQLKKLLEFVDIDSHDDIANRIRMLKNQCHRENMAYIQKEVSYA